MMALMLTLALLKLKSFLLQRITAVLCCLSVILAAGGQSVCFAETGVRQTDVRAEAAEAHLPTDQPLTPWLQDPAVFQEDQGDRTETRTAVARQARTIKLEKLVPPIHFGLGEVQITAEYLQMLRAVLDNMRDRANVRLHFIGHADSLPLTGELMVVYGDNVGSVARAGGYRGRVLPAGAQSAS